MDATGSGVFSDEVDSFIHTDAASLAQRFKDTWTEVSNEIKKPNVLLMGVTGAGKSSVVNAVFGAQLAVVGTGVPITQHYSKIEIPRHPVSLFDSKGLEHGQHEEFLHATRHFLSEHNDRAGPAERVHVIWYVLNSANARFQPFERQLCKDILKDIPIIFIMNKADISTDESRRTIHRLIDEMELSNCLGVFETVADSKQTEITRQFDECPKCGSDNITIKARQKLCVCDNCGEKTSLVQKNGLDQVIRTTIQALPDFAKDAFIAAQTFSFSLKEDRAFSIIREHYEEAANIRLYSTLKKNLAKMLTRLAILWDFRQHGPLYCRMVAEELVGSMPIRDKVFLFITRKKSVRLETTATGILWTRCLRNMATILLNEFILKNRNVDELDHEWDAILDEAFADLNEENLESIIDSIEKKGFDKTLEDTRLPSSS
eukprot:TRINITY_DN648_c0_g1_i1.p1 TRINITY_DN648_c0_g1~~TRINITY_DN648_c0_g1_i1.p1  ORF type:complete len:431 (+),score=110.20 TRINITY_DN648_c0_g1_i1:65-1357(+)